MKRLQELLLCSFALLNLFCIPAQALPGQNQQTVRQWLTKHTFLLEQSPYPDPERPGVWGVGRPLSAGRMIIFETWFNAQGLVMGENIYLHVPPQAPDSLNLFDRENPTTLRLLSLMYGEEIATDFQKSRLIYSGSKLYDGKLSGPNPKRLKFPTRKDFFLGKRYAYMSSYTPSGPDSPSNIWLLSITLRQVVESSISQLKQEKKFAEQNQSAEQAAQAKTYLEKQNQALLQRRQFPIQLENPD
ncbi:hypothetical protein COW36_18670 [bacterium (Candidatus Blackallbacteria) CG17_big_fil_post_rev_8_21_14_2_50_48_46]|uniref:Uncharacterized protein n=1 Tax=bacterium (Candidatus Blackallbacteria) CG17_big_fil_post_rev_8_21_14_2_50_48_46 TaxID=2014261 RepID=A0A2M7G158_9BACT|nr:MAG: hypothetical protein COW64_00065 [bacterium (Candidatus Blackallbacteria) CG18_big_fil_WC_8_21_14_2_50_49_26]PIW15438.1 MAG: hypothetical protein COW36_18670 [bacterium (Candidatus Blackallbacteria) CG17_big_fil_post_rev_8_21_14_2_50_48_46]PIW49701.1 MAG: hypothetical protein COW20_04695 [bacterium (Candidatus Blackallbacteria) CG13_big_fil_rev_8_21_14_2_50_49_14]